MVEKISSEDFMAADGVGDWRVLDSGEIGTCFRTGTFDAGVDLIVRIGKLADAANHHPDVDLRYPTVTVRMITHDAGGLTERDVALARQISAVATEMGVEADPGAAG